VKISALGTATRGERCGGAASAIVASTESGGERGRKIISNSRKQQAKREGRWHAGSNGGSNPMSGAVGNETRRGWRAERRRRQRLKR